MGPSPRRARFAAAVIDRTPDWSALAVSRMMGWASRLRLPRPLSRLAVSTYARWFDVDLGEVEPDALERGFASFDAFFTRRLRHGARALISDRDALVSPCDGTVRESGPIRDIIEAKGHAYDLADLVVDPELAQRLRGGTMATIYLHPRNYHRVHAPCDGRVGRVVLVPGRLLPVTDAALDRAPGLFALNERMIHVMETSRGCVAVVMIAAFGVGHMSCAYEPVVAHPERHVEVLIAPPASIQRGDELGVFHLGSTVIVLAEAVYDAASSDCGPIRFGEALLHTRLG